MCQYVGLSRAGYYKSLQAQAKKIDQQQQVSRLVLEVRRHLPAVGGKKLYKLLKGELERLDQAIGRDKFFEMLRSGGLLVKRRRKYVKTTSSWHRYHKYKNKLKHTTITAPGQAYASDITYLRTRQGFVYLFLQTDVYSRMITGWSLAENLAAAAAMQALRMTFQQSKNGLRQAIHHSDRGIQYCCDEYNQLMADYGMQVSMTEENHCYENAMAERVNGILKQEFLLEATFNDFKAARSAVKEAIYSYNHRRPHWSLHLQTPAQLHHAA